MISLKKCSNRRICTFSEDCPFKNVKARSAGTGKHADFSKLIKYIDENVIGRNTTFLGPFGRRKVTYCDYTSTAKALNFIEEYILKEVLPLYSITNTVSNVTNLQSSLYRQEAREIIKNAIHAFEDDAVIFTGNDRVEALNKLINIMILDEPPTVFVGSNEHHSILLPWQIIGAKIIRIAETKEGFLDLIDLENKLQKEKQLRSNLDSHAQFIGCFSAASNVTGILADDIATTILLHQYGAFSFWDYDIAAPYVPLDMNPLLPGNDTGVQKDAIFFSGHKFVGGTQSSGILVAKKKLLRKEIFSENNNKAIFHPKVENQERFKDNEAVEKIETETIIDSIRIGLIMHLKQTTGPPNIMAREHKIAKGVLSFIRTIPEIILLGNRSHTVKRLSIYSFVVKHPRGVFLHHNFICAILNDVFGIQVQSGCSCATLYAYDLLGIDDKLASHYEDVLENKCNQYEIQNDLECLSNEGLRPGFIRISLPYFMSDTEITFILEAIKMVATEGWKLLPQYVFYPENGEWKHRTSLVFRERKWLSSLRFIDGKMTANERKISGQSPFPQDFSECLNMARNIFNKARKMAHRYPLCDQRIMFEKNTENLRWFMLPSEAQDLLLGHSQKVKTCIPFSPGEYNGSRANSFDSDTIMENIPQKNNPLLLDACSFYSRHNSLTSYEISQLKRNASVNKESSPVCRTRCYSLESSSISPQSRLLSSVDNGHCSCGSQTDISDAESVTKESQITTDFSDFNDMGIVTLFPNTENENIQAYVKGVTEELATEIKTEIREVIATVDNVLSESMENLNVNIGASYDKTYSSDFRRTSSIPMLTKTNYANQQPQYSLPLNVNNDKTSLFYPQSPFNKMENNQMNNEDTRNRVSNCDSKVGNDLVSDHVAVYLAELTSEMVTEMKTELREMVNAVDDIISPSTNDKLCSKPQHIKLVVEEEWDIDDNNQFNKEKCVKDNENEDIVEEIKVFKTQGKEIDEIKSSVKSDSSSDSGVAEINSKESPTKTVKKKISVVSRESKSVCNLNNDQDTKVCLTEIVTQSNIDKRKKVPENTTLQPKWHCPPKPLWKPTVEAIREYDMVREGDKVLICLSGGKDSLSLLHTLHQYQYYSHSYGITFTFGAVTIDFGYSTYNLRSLIPYLNALGVQYLFEEHNSSTLANEVNCSINGFCNKGKRKMLYKIAANNKYNVLALGQHLDDFAESFLSSAFHDGSLRSMKAHYYNREYDLRVIRPFVYAREKHIRQFAENRKLPVIKDNFIMCYEIPKERLRIKQLLAQQEIFHPKLFSNLKTALLPLISFKHPNEESTPKKRKQSRMEENDTKIFIDSETEEEDPS